MKRNATILLQSITVLVGVALLALMLWEPHLEGRNAHATLSQIYFQDPFLAYAYVASIAFFAALYQAFRLCGYIGRNQASSKPAIHAVQSIKRCMLVLIAFIAGAEGYFMIVQRGQEDIAGGVVLGLGMILISAAIATTAAVAQKHLFAKPVNR